MAIAKANKSEKKTKSFRLLRACGSGKKYKLLWKIAKTRLLKSLVFDLFNIRNGATVLEYERIIGF